MSDYYSKNINLSSPQNELFNHQNSFEFKGLYSKKCFLDKFAEKIKECSQIQEKNNLIYFNL
jgi:hypothetical protein